MRILFFAPRIPAPPLDGGSSSIYHQLTGLRRAGHHVCLVAPNTSRHRARVNASNEMYDVLITDNVDTSVTFKGALAALLSKKEPLSTHLPTPPYTISRFLSTKIITDTIAHLKTTTTYDIIHIDYLFAAWYGVYVHEHFKIPALYRAHNIEHKIVEQLANDKNRNVVERTYRKLLARQTERFETAIAQNVDLIAPVSEDDYEWFRKVAPTTRCEAINVGVQFVALSDIKRNATSSPTLGMLGSLEWGPNIEGIVWFVHQVLPIVRRSIPNVVLKIAGRAPVQEVLDLHNGGSVQVIGPVDSASEFLNSVHVALSPVLSGSGVRIKILEGLAHSVPMISTTLGAQGLKVKDEEHLLIADSPEEFAVACIKLLTDRAAAEELGSNGRQLIEREYSWDASIEKLVAAYASII